MTRSSTCFCRSAEKSMLNNMSTAPRKVMIVPQVTRERYQGSLFVECKNWSTTGSIAARIDGIAETWARTLGSETAEVTAVSILLLMSVASAIGGRPRALQLARDRGEGPSNLH